VQRLDAATGALSVIAGNGLAGGGGDNGPAASAQLNRPSGLAFDATGNLYVADAGNFRVRKISGCIITTVAGNGTWGNGPDGILAVDSQLSGPHGVAVDGAGNLYISDTNSCRVRKVANGVMSTVAGLGGCGYGGQLAGRQRAAELPERDRGGFGRHPVHR
jgi:trimeric autotransporter adhesin